MKRRDFLSAILSSGCLPTVLAGAGETAGQLRIATFDVDVTPPLGTPLCHGNVRPAERIVDPLSARGLILTGQGQPIVLCTFDWTGIGNGANDFCRAELAKAVGTSPDRVAVHVVHQHDAPGVDFSSEEILASYGLGGNLCDAEVAREAILRVAKAAGECLSGAVGITHVGRGIAKVQKVASTRRVMGENGKVKYVRLSRCKNKAMIDAPEGKIDPYLRVVSFWDGERPVAAVNYYACHGQSYYGQGGVSGDFIGMARRAREAALPGVAQIYFDGAGGDIACGKYNDGSAANRPVLARRLEAGMKAAWEATERTPITAADVEWRVNPVSLPVRQRTTEAWCKKMLEDDKVSVRERAHVARDLAFLRRMKGGHKIPLTCLRLGQTYVVHMPGELFVHYQLAAQEMRPDDFVCMAAYGDAGTTYIGSKAAYSQGGYEVTRSRVSPQVEDVLIPAIRRLLLDD